MVYNKMTTDPDLYIIGVSRLQVGQVVLVAIAITCRIGLDLTMPITVQIDPTNNTQQVLYVDVSMENGHLSKKISA